MKNIRFTTLLTISILLLSLLMLSFGTVNNAKAQADDSTINSTDDVISYQFSYTGWSAWSACTRSCGTGTETHTRSCTNIFSNTTHDCGFCGGDCYEARNCNIQACPQPARLEGSPTSASWAEGVTMWHSFNIRNKGDEPTGNITGSFTSGGAYFESNFNNCTRLNPGQACIFHIRSNASARGTVTGTLTVTANPGGTITQTLTAEGPSGISCGSWRSWGTCRLGDNNIYNIFLSGWYSRYGGTFNRSGRAACAARCESRGERCCMWAPIGSGVALCMGANASVRAPNGWAQGLAFAYGQPHSTFATSCQ